ncbi:RNA polymerase sigma factor [Corynebacterium bovis]|uniref:RNA polymerase sigma factor n=1 Tax=Corynebacterium bovis TaxID=36808 RepID=UPI000F649F55|nr:RNA polymerase sigma factor [Corynebacterium bovis]RRO80599.1 RNA polymerase subunit sigma [Corynebacterium bovis]RRO82228.1 RNA polymerase subunit sigma [Corynebacterium bovis]RRO83236.1 RNA polymerase subunit sigma [Corynebacterium bovis]RRO88110.1 RNA polymerase subunit sigma [Corynebacterium bovis]
MHQTTATDGTAPDGGHRRPGRPDDTAVTDLALRAATADRTALNAFIQATHQDVWRLLAHLADTDRADDLTQETYLRVLGALPRFAARSTARTWILSLARRVWVDSVRHDMARPRKSTAQWEDAAEHSPSPDTAGDQTWAELVDARALLDLLDPERREALVLTQVLGYTYAEAADIAGVRVGTIRSRVARARADMVAAQDAARAAGEAGDRSRATARTAGLPGRGDDATLRRTGGLPGAPAARRRGHLRDVG